MQADQGQAESGASRELLTFTLGNEEYGIDILKVQEIRGYDAVTTIANSPDFIKGVINLRGIIVPPAGWPASAPNGYGGSDTTVTAKTRSCTVLVTNGRCASTFAAVHTASSDAGWKQTPSRSTRFISTGVCMAVFVSAGASSTRCCPRRGFIETSPRCTTC